MTRTDAMFHAALASMLIVGALCVGSISENLWGTWNKGVSPMALKCSNRMNLLQQDESFARGLVLQS